MCTGPQAPSNPRKHSPNIKIQKYKRKIYKIQNTKYKTKHTKKKCACSVTSKWLIGLTWSAPDDLDLHVITPNGSDIFYGNKDADGCKLDFDANVSEGETDPCENVSCKPGAFVIRVDNYTRRTKGDIHFHVICRQAGMPDVVYGGVWGVNQQKGNMIVVATHTFTPISVDVVDTAMSTNSAAPATALDSEWNASIGEPTAIVSTDITLTAKAGVSVFVLGRVSPYARTTDSAAAGRSFMSMATSANEAVNTGAVPKTGAAPDKKPYLSENCRKRMPVNTAQLIAYLNDNPSADVSVEMRNHPPGYLVELDIKDDGVRKSTLPSLLCHYDRKYAYPAKPTLGAMGNGRLDEEWLEKPCGRIAVSAVVDVGGVTFLALSGATLPRSEQAWPLGSGFYPTDLTAEYHKHRERWTFLHTQLKPSMPVVRQCAETKEISMIGTFLVGESADVWINGIKLTIKCN